MLLPYLTGDTTCPLLSLKEKRAMLSSRPAYSSAYWEEESRDPLPRPKWRRQRVIAPLKGNLTGHRGLCFPSSLGLKRHKRTLPTDSRLRAANRLSLSHRSEGIPYIYPT